MKRASFVVVLTFGLAACGGGSGDSGPDAGPVDLDGDGVPAAEDCDDNDPNKYPGAPEPCDGRDNDCDFQADEDWDNDDDLFTSCGGDCADNDGYTYPGAPELVDGLDNDCDGIPDNHTDQYDDDGDGYTEDQGDCNDDENAGGELIGPGAMEIQTDSDGDPEGIDNDCDGEIDEAPLPCPTDVANGSPEAYLAALDICEGGRTAYWRDSMNIDARSRGVFADYGPTYVPRMGQSLAALATGVAGDDTDPGFIALDPGTEFTNQVPHPDMVGAIGCSSADSATVNDFSELVLELDVPANARAFAFDFNFMSVEFPEFVCTDYDDTFIAYLESEGFTGNVSFDAMGQRVSVNVGFFNVCNPALGASCTGAADLGGTGYQADGGGTGWLTTTAPVTPGEKIRLSFMIWDEGDHILDSAVLLDNFRWELEEVDGPITVP